MAPLANEFEFGLLNGIECNCFAVRVYRLDIKKINFNECKYFRCDHIHFIIYHGNSSNLRMVDYLLDSAALKR